MNCKEPVKSASECANDLTLDSTKRIAFNFIFPKSTSSATTANPATGFPFSSIILPLMPILPLFISKSSKSRISAAFSLDLDIIISLSIRISSFIFILSYDSGSV